MSFNWHTRLLGVLCCLSAIGAQQLFEQPSTLTVRNLVHTIYTAEGGAGVGAAQLPNHATAQRAPTQIIKATTLQEVRDSEALAPFFQQLLKQTMPNWQTEKQQRGQQQQQREAQQGQWGQQQQHFFVELPSQQPQILHGYNGVNVRQQQQLQQQQQQQLQQHQLPQSASLAQQQLQQQQPFTQLPIQQQQQSYTTYLQTSPKIALAPHATATTTATQTAAATTIGVVAPLGSLANSFQPTSPQAQNTTMEQCELCCDPLAPPNTACGCCKTKPLLGAALLKATTG